MEKSARRMIVFMSALLALLVMLRVPPEPRAHPATSDVISTPGLEAGSRRNADAKTQFHRDVLPILTDKCFHCHGPDAGPRKADLRLDTREGILATRKRGAAVVPGSPSTSRLIVRVEDTDDAMPPAPHPPLSMQEKATLRRWIAEGAAWGEHWSFTPVQKPHSPSTKLKGWSRNAIDRFVLSKMEQQNLTPAPEADRATLLRRLTLDLNGLPPTPDEIDAFLREESPDAYERVVDRLLASPRFGEHMARYWLDASRYGDTHGTHLDNFREAWNYRDWVIRAFNEAMPYDRFLTEQIAGDLLPNASTAQRVATGFLRNQVSTGDVDSLREAEAQFAAATGMAETVATVSLGLTLGCAKCHDHRYDPLTQKDYYRFYSLFNNNDGTPFDYGAPYPHPAVAVPTQDELLKDYHLRVAMTELEKTIQERLKSLPPTVGMGEPVRPARETQEYIWLDDQPARAEYVRFESGIEDVFFGEAPKQPVLSGKQSLRMQDGNQQLFWIHKFEPTLIVDEGDVIFAHVWLDPAKPPRMLLLEFLRNGWNHRAFWGEDLAYQGKLGSTRQSMGPLPEKGKWVRIEVPAQHVGLKPGMEVTGVGFRQFQGGMYWDKVGLKTKLRLGKMGLPTFADWLEEQAAQRGRHLPAALGTAIRKPAAERTPAEVAQLRERYLIHDCPDTRPQFAEPLAKLRQHELDLYDLHRGMSRALVFQESATKRKSFFHTRGEWSKPADEVSPGTPASLPALMSTAIANRLDLANWITHPEHPLTARVAVNRFWQNLLGAGLVRTSDDFGKRGELPTHPELLDWLANDFRFNGWDVKRLLKQIVMSRTYRQSCRGTSESVRLDPENRYLSRSSRHRLDAETLRDQALSLGGLLVEKVGGPSVKPPQPPGMWELVATRNSNTKVFVADVDPRKTHRRSLYTFWKRTGHSPQMGILDAPSRETCVIRRERTNTPMQALLLLNEEQFLATAQGLASRSQPQGSVPEQLAWMFRIATGRVPSLQEQEELFAQFESHRQHFAQHSESAAQLAGSATPTDEAAARTMVAHLILNLDEVLCRP